MRNFGSDFFGAISSFRLYLFGFSYFKPKKDTGSIWAKPEMTLKQITNTQ
jgi:hypothetical protein